MSVTSVATPGVPSQTFEADATASFTGPSNVPVTLPPDTALQLGADGEPQSVLLAGRVSGVGAGDQLVLARSGFAGRDSNWSVVTVGSITPAPDPGTGAVNTLVTFSASARGSTGPAPAPPLSGLSTSFRLLRPAAAAALWNRGTPASGQEVVAQDGTGVTVHLSAAVRAISPGDMALFDCGAGRPSALGSVTATHEVLWAVPYPALPGGSSPNPPDIVIAHTALAVATTDSAALRQAEAAAVTVRYAFKDVGTIIGVPAAALARLPAAVAVPAACTPPLAATAFLQGATGTGLLVTVAASRPGQVTLAGAGSPPSTITTPLAVPLQLLPDVFPVSRGTTVTGEVLGSGNAALASQSFMLSKSPLTYLAGGSGPVSTLAVYVNGVAWQEVPSFYGQAPDARVFTVSRSPDQTVTTATFGDGVNGARLPSGTGNVIASYRYGSGSASPPAERLTTIGQPQPNLASIQNPVPVSGGADPQAPEDVRADAPASVFTFGRAISAADYEVIAAQAPGVSRAAASWAFDVGQQRTLVTIYVDGGPGRPRRRAPRSPPPVTRTGRSWCSARTRSSSACRARSSLRQAGRSRPWPPRRPRRCPPREGCSVPAAWASGSGSTAAPSTPRSWCRAWSPSATWRSPGRGGSSTSSSTRAMAHSSNSRRATSRYGG